MKVSHFKRLESSTGNSSLKSCKFGVLGHVRSCSFGAEDFSSHHTSSSAAAVITSVPYFCVLLSLSGQAESFCPSRLKLWVSPHAPHTSSEWAGHISINIRNIKK